MNVEWYPYPEQKPEEDETTSYYNNVGDKQYKYCLDNFDECVVA